MVGSNPIEEIWSLKRLSMKFLDGGWLQLKYKCSIAMI